MVKVSVIIPVYNVENYLSKCLDSVFSQTLDSYEVIAINDGSNDNSLNILNTYLKKYSNLKIIDQCNQGISKSRNLGISESKGEYIMFLDSDDYMENNMLYDMYIKAKSESLDIVVCDYYTVYSSTVSKQLEKVSDFSNTTITDSKNLIFEINPSPWNKLFKSSFLKQQKYRFPLDLKYEDLGYIPLLFLNAKKIGKVNKPLYNYMVRENSQTTIVDDRIFDIFSILNILYREYSSHNIHNTSEVEYLFIKKLTTYNLQQKYCKNSKIGYKFVDESFGYLSAKYPKWRNNIYLKKESFIKRAIKKNKFLTKIYIFIGGSHENKK